MRISFGEGEEVKEDKVFRLSEIATMLADALAEAPESDPLVAFSDFTEDFVGIESITYDLKLNAIIVRTSFSQSSNLSIARQLTLQAESQ